MMTARDTSVGTRRFIQISVRASHPAVKRLPAPITRPGRLENRDTIEYGAGMQRRLPVIAATCLLCAGAAQSSEIRLHEDRLSLKANHESLRDVLAEFVRAGVDVKLEPGIDAVVDGTLDDEPIDEGLDALLDSFNYVLYWDVLQGPVGPLTRLAGMHVFRPGQRHAVVPFHPQGNTLVPAHLPGAPLHAKDELLLGLKPGTTAKQFRELLAWIDATAVGSISSFGIYQVRLPRDSNVPAIVATLKNNPWVAAAEPNYIHQIAAPVSDTSDGGTRSASTAADPPPGAAAMAIFDSGLMDLDLLGDSVVGTYDAVDPSQKITDALGHGTQMALIASGAVVPRGLSEVTGENGVPIIAIKAFDDEGQSSNYSLLRGMNFAIAEGGRVISMSWGTDVESAFLEHAVQYAQENDMVVVAAAGNEPNGQPVYPAAYHGVIAVSAMTADGRIWDRSNYGSFVSAAGPGSATFPVGHNGPPGAYVGTSIATPVVASALTQYFANHPDATAVEATAALNDALTDLGDPGRDDYYGHGALDAEALKRLLE